MPKEDLTKKLAARREKSKKFRETFKKHTETVVKATQDLPDKGTDIAWKRRNRQ